jgi:catechol 2,3-dioxygenase-like lactoylglutathione lyase family enzyme
VDETAHRVCGAFSWQGVSNMAATATAAAVKFHIGLHVADLDRSVNFYRVLLGCEPARHLADHARFEPASPPLVLALIPNPQVPGGSLNHLGFRLPDSAALVEVQRRLEQAGIATQRQEGVECCYARQTKFWVTDPDGNLCELYVFEDDLDHSGFDDPPHAPCREPSSSAITWQHVLTEPIPDRIPHAAASVDEVRLEGTFNAPLDESRLERFLEEVRRVLRPAGKVTVHALVADKLFPANPKLPGLASLVQRVPVEAEVPEALTRAGFTGICYEHFGDIHCFQVNGVELRQMRLTALREPELSTQGTARVLYKGPLAEVMDEDGTLFRRGEPIDVPLWKREILRRELAASDFVFFPLSPT